MKIKKFLLSILFFILSATIVFSQDINTSGISEYDIFINIYSLIIFNNNSFPIRIKIHRMSITDERVLEPDSYENWRLFPDVDYLIESFYVNGTKIIEQDVG